MPHPHRNDFTIVIQGPATKVSIEKIPIYNTFGKVIVSHWDSDLISLDGVDCEEVVSDFQYWSEQAGKINNAYNLLYQVVTTLEGLKVVTTKYVIKVRGDEYYTDLTPVMESLITNPERVVTNSVFYVSNYASMSDHLIGSDTLSMRRAFQELLYLVLGTRKRGHNVCIEPEELRLKFAKELVIPGQRGLIPEQCITLSLLRCKGYMTSNLKTFKQMVNMIPLEQLGDICVHSNSENDTYCHSPEECYQKFWFERGGYIND